MAGFDPNMTFAARFGNDRSQENLPFTMSRFRARAFDRVPFLSAASPAMQMDLESGQFTPNNVALSAATLQKLIASRQGECAATLRNFVDGPMGG